MALKNSVTLQEYNQTLRDAVNAYYEHAMNDPSMSREEALSSTAQMAEQALTAGEEFQANVEAQSLSTENSNGVATGNEIATDSNEVAVENDGIEGGEEGGIDSDDGGIE